MMKSFRKLTNNLAFKVVLGIVALSFIFFGVSSFILGGSTSWVAKIGSKKISYSTLQKAMKENREMIINSYGNNEQALAYLDSEQFTSDSLEILLTCPDLTRNRLPDNSFGRSFSTATVINVCSAEFANLIKWILLSSSNSENTSSKIRIGFRPSFSNNL